MDEIFYNILKKAFWLKESEKESIQKALNSSLYSYLSLSDLEKLCKILSVIPLSEKKIRKEGKKSTHFLKIILQNIPFFNRCFLTLSVWNLNVCHAKKFHIPQGLFRKILNSTGAIHYVIQYLLFYIGIQKEPEMIFAEYVIQEQATLLAAIQKGINILLHNKQLFPIMEDGILGEETKKAWHFLSLPFDFYQQERYQDVLLYLELVTKTKIFPFIPQTRCKRDIGYLWQVIRKKEWKKIWNYFRNHVDVPLYVSSGLTGYRILE